MEDLSNDDKDDESMDEQGFPDFHMPRPPHSKPLLLVCHLQQHVAPLPADCYVTPAFICDMYM